MGSDETNVLFDFSFWYVIILIAQRTTIQGGILMDKLKNRLAGIAKKAGIILTAAWYGNIYVYADPFDTMESGLQNVLTGLVKVGKALFPVAIVIIIVMLFWTRDERKLAMEIKIGIALCVAYVLMIIMGSGASNTVAYGRQYSVSTFIPATALETTKARNLT